MDKEYITYRLDLISNTQFNIYNSYINNRSVAKLKWGGRYGGELIHVDKSWRMALIDFDVAGIRNECPVIHRLLKHIERIVDTSKCDWMEFN